jgi:hypothetical protein
MHFDQSACIFRVSQEFQWCQGLRDIAAIYNSAFRAKIMYIISFLSLSKFQLWRNQSYNCKSLRHKSMMVTG